MSGSELSSYIERVGRMIAAGGRRVGEGDIDALPLLHEMRAVIDAAEHAAIDGLIASGYSYADVAKRLRVTPQAVHKRWAIHRQPQVDGRRAIAS